MPKPGAARPRTRRGSFAKKKPGAGIKGWTGKAGGGASRCGTGAGGGVGPCGVVLPGRGLGGGIKGWKGRAGSR